MRSTVFITKCNQVYLLLISRLKHETETSVFSPRQHAGAMINVDLVQTAAMILRFHASNQNFPVTSSLEANLLSKLARMK